MNTDRLIEAIGVTMEAMGQQLTPAALVLMAEDLAEYDLQAVLRALHRVRRECRRMTLADIVERIESGDGRPAADEAWMAALLAHDEAETVVWTEETAQAFEIARPALQINDKVGARMAFKAAYDRLVTASREANQPARWTASIGFDVERRRLALDEAARAGRLAPAYVQGLLPPPAEVASRLALENNQADKGRVSATLNQIRRMLGVRSVPTGGVSGMRTE